MKYAIDKNTYTFPLKNYSEGTIMHMYNFNSQNRLSSY